MDSCTCRKYHGRASAPYQRVLVVCCVALLHVAALMVWLTHPADAAAPKREMEVSLLAATVVIHPQMALPRSPPERARVPQARAALPGPELQPAAQVVQVGEGADNAADPPAPVVAAEPAIQPEAQDTEPDYKASYLNNRLAYPMMARRRGIQGRVVLDVEVLADGECGQAGVAQSSGHRMLDRAALESVKSWHFVPARHGALAVTRWFKVPITYTLKDDEA